MLTLKGILCIIKKVNERHEVQGLREVRKVGYTGVFFSGGQRAENVYL